jgi:hypothetical protein
MIPAACRGRGKYPSLAASAAQNLVDCIGRHLLVMQRGNRGKAGIVGRLTHGEERDVGSDA